MKNGYLLKAVADISAVAVTKEHSGLRIISRDKPTIEAEAVWRPNKYLFKTQPDIRRIPFDFFHGKIDVTPLEMPKPYKEDYNDYDNG